MFFLEFIIAGLTCFGIYFFVDVILRLFKATQPVFTITIIILWLISTLILIYNDFGLGCIVGNCVSAVLAFFTAKALSVICPNCGVWNEYEEVQVLDTNTYSQWETVERDIKDNKGNKIGSYESRELQTYRTTKKLLKCNNCDELFEKDYTEKI